MRSLNLQQTKIVEVEAACNVMLDEMKKSSDPMKAIAAAAGLFYNGTSGQKKCFKIYDDFIECADPTGMQSYNIKIFKLSNGRDVFFSIIILPTLLRSLALI